MASVLALKTHVAASRAWRYVGTTTVSTFAQRQETAHVTLQLVLVVDGLMGHGYAVHLVNTTAIPGTTASSMATTIATSGTWPS